MGKLKSLSQPASADFWVFSTYFSGNFSTFCCINLKQEVEKTQKSAEAGCLKLLSLPNFFFYSVAEIINTIMNLVFILLNYWNTSHVFWMHTPFKNDWVQFHGNLFFRWNITDWNICPQ